MIALYIIFWEIHFTQLLQFQHWYIIILWFHCIIIFIEVAHRHCFPFVSTYFLLLLLTSHFITSFKISIFVADHDSCAAKDGLFLYYIDTSSCLLVRLLCFSVMSADEGILRCKDIFGAVDPLACSSHFAQPAPNPRNGINSRLFDHRSWLILCSACPAVFIHSFRFVYQFHFTLYH